MKKFVSAIVVLAMVLAMLPMAVLALGSISYDIAIGSEQMINLLSDDTITLNITTEDKAAVLKVDGLGNNDWFIYGLTQTHRPNVMGFCEIQLEPETTYTLSLISDCFDDQTLKVTLKTPTIGSEETPAELVIGENVTVVDGMSPYFYTWTAPESGNLTVAINTDKCSDWSYQINNGDVNYSDLDPVTPFQTVNMNAGDVCTINVNTANWGSAGTIYFDASFEPGAYEGGEGEGEGGEGGYEGIIGTVVKSETVHINSASAMQETDMYKVVDYIAVEEGTVYINMSSPDYGWSLMVYKNGEALTWMMTGSESETFEYPVKAGDTLTFEMGAYDPVVSWGSVDGKITYVISFNAGEIEIEKEEYIISDTLLYLGDNDIGMVDNALNSLFEFNPEQTGVYVFTAPEGILLGDWGQFFNPHDITGENKTNTIQWVCTDIGQNVLIGVFSEENIVLNVERIGDYIPAPVIPWTEFEITSKLDYFEMDMDDEFIPVDVTDDEADVAVLGADGYYHLGSENGPILFIDLNMYLYPAAGYGNVSHVVYDEQGNVVEKINYTNAVYEYYSYSDGGIYPLTADLIEFYKNFGSDQGWYDPDGMGFYLFGEDVVDPETAWMFACSYVEGKNCFLSEYYVAGEAGLCGSNWVPGDPANQMIMNADGTCSITFQNVAAGKYMFKVTQTDWSMDNWGGNGPDGNYVIELKSETYVTIVFDPATGTISVATGDNVSTGDHSIAGLVVAMLAATAGAVVLTKKKEF